MADGAGHIVGDDVAIDGRRWSAAANSGGRGRQWKIVAARDDRWWQMGRAVATNGGRHWWTMWPSVTDSGRRGGQWKMVVASDGRQW